MSYHCYASSSTSSLPATARLHALPCCCACPVRRRKTIEKETRPRSCDETWSESLHPIWRHRRSKTNDGLHSEAGVRHCLGRTGCHHGQIEFNLVVVFVVIGSEERPQRDSRSAAAVLLLLGLLKTTVAAAVCFARCRPEKRTLLLFALLHFPPPLGSATADQMCWTPTWPARNVAAATSACCAVVAVVVCTGALPWTEEMAGGRLQWRRMIGDRDGDVGLPPGLDGRRPRRSPKKNDDEQCPRHCSR